MQKGRRDSVQSTISARRATENNKEKQPPENKSTFNETVIVSDSDDERQRPQKPTMSNEFIFLNSVIFEYSRSDMQTLNEIQLQPGLEQQNLQAENGMVQSFYKNWIYDRNQTIEQNIGQCLRQVYLTKSRKEEKTKASSWKLYVSDDEGQMIRIQTTKDVQRSI